MKYRIIVASSLVDCPYKIEKKNDGYFSLWHEIGKYSTLARAEMALPELADRHNKIPKGGTVLRVYTQEDLLVDKLNGKLRPDKATSNLVESSVGAANVSTNARNTSGQIN